MNPKVSESDYQLAMLLRSICSGGQMKYNPYSYESISFALDYLAKSYGLGDKYDAAELVIARYEKEQGQ